MQTLLPLLWHSMQTTTDRISCYWMPFLLLFLKQLCLLLLWPLQVVMPGNILITYLLANLRLGLCSWKKILPLFNGVLAGWFEFLHAVKVIVDELLLIDAPISDDDLTLYMLNSFGSEFQDMVAPICTRKTALSFVELHDLLIGHEHYLKRMDGKSSTLIVTANTSQWRSSSPRLKNNKNHFK